MPAKAGTLKFTKKVEEPFFIMLNSIKGKRVIRKDY